MEEGKPGGCLEWRMSGVSGHFWELVHCGVSWAAEGGKVLVVWMSIVCPLIDPLQCPLVALDRNLQEMRDSGDINSSLEY